MTSLTGSLNNAVLHILAYSYELGLGLKIDDFDDIAQQVKCLCGVIPSGRYTVIDFYNAGGVPAVARDEIKEGDIIVLRYEGHQDSPGMNELMKITDSLIAKGMEEKVALISDGLFSGFNHGTIIGHVAPEAMVGGLIAFVEDGDLIEYSIPKGKLNLLVSDNVIAERKKA